MLSTPPPELPRGLSPVTPVLGRRGEFEPKAGGFVIVDLPGEKVRCEILEVLSRDVIVARVGMVVDKSNHGYKRDQKIAVQRTWSPETLEIWEPVTDREVREQEELDRVRQRVAREQTEEAAAKLRAREEGGEAQEPVIDPPLTIDEATLLPDVPRGTEEPRRKVLGPRRSKISKSPAEASKPPRVRSKRAAG